MSKILIVGNVVRDTYLKLDERQVKFERDDRGVKWMDLGFNGGRAEFYRRTSCVAGAAISREVLANCGAEVQILGWEPFMDAQDFRYILSNEDNQVCYFSGKIPVTRFLENFNDDLEEEYFDYLYIDRSALLGETEVYEILDYLRAHERTRLIYYAARESVEMAQLLADEAILVFAEMEGDEGALGRSLKIDERKLCIFEPDGLKMRGRSVKWQLKNADLATHLTIYLTAAATIVGGILNRQKFSEVLELARLNVERSRIDDSLSWNELQTARARELKLLRDEKYVAAELMSGKKGVLALDESVENLGKKFAVFGIPNDFEHRRDFRNLLLTTPELNHFLNGVILDDETARTLTIGGVNVLKYLTSQGIISGIKADLGLEKYSDGTGETWTRGLEGLEERLRDYFKMGARFCKWRAAFEVKKVLIPSAVKKGMGEETMRTIITPSRRAVRENCRLMAEYARECQQEGLVPICEPEVVSDGKYDLKYGYGVTRVVLETLIEELKKADVCLEACIIKMNMVMAGKAFAGNATEPEVVGKLTSQVLREICPVDLAGVLFLSGGLSSGRAIECLHETCEESDLDFPVSFCFGRALTDDAMKVWDGKGERELEAQTSFLSRLQESCGAL